MIHANGQFPIEANIKADPGHVHTCVGHLPTDVFINGRQFPDFYHGCGEDGFQLLLQVLAGDFRRKCVVIVGVVLVVLVIVIFTSATTHVNGVSRNGIQGKGFTSTRICRWRVPLVVVIVFHVMIQQGPAIVGLVKYHLDDGVHVR